MANQPTAPAYEPPAGLSGHASDVWRKVTAGRSLSDAQLETLRQALMSLDRADAAADQVAAEGAVIPDRWGGLKAHPAVEIEARHRSLFVTTMAKLNIDGVAKQIGRPGAVSGAGAKARRLRAV